MTCYADLRCLSILKAMPGMKHQKERVGAGSLSPPHTFSMCR